MSLFDPIYRKINTITALTGKVTHADVLKGASAPFVFWLQDSETAEEALTGLTELCEAEFEVHICSKYLEEIDNLSAAVKSKVLSLQGTESDGFCYERIVISSTSPTLRETEVGFYRKVFRLTINYQVSNSDTNE